MTTTDTALRVTMSPDGFGAPLMRVYGTVSPDQIATAKQHIDTVLHDLERISIHFNATGCDDDFGQPNLADLAIEELVLALEALR